MGASDRRKLWICRFAWTTQTRCPHTHSSDRKKRRKRLEDSFEQEENRNGRRLYTLISTVPGPSDGVHLKHPDRDAQFEYINAKVEEFHAADQPVICKRCSQAACCLALVL